MEGLPHPCFGGDVSGEYVRRHDPFMYFPSICVESRLAARRSCPPRRLDADIRRHSLPEFAWIEPGTLPRRPRLRDRASSTSTSRGFVPRLSSQLGPAGFLVVTFDEGKSDRGCCGGPGGGRVATIVAGPKVRSGARLRRPYDHYSLLATIEEVFGLRRLRSARGAASLRAAFEPERHSHGR